MQPNQDEGEYNAVRWFVPWAGYWVTDLVPGAAKGKGHPLVYCLILFCFFTHAGECIQQG